MEIRWTDRVKMTYDIESRRRGRLIGVGYILLKNCLLRDVVEG